MSFCQICHGPWPDGHEAWCPIKTGEPIAGSISPQSLHSRSRPQDLVAATEELCQALRDLRRDNPELFFGQPLERLYDRLESALASYYREKR